MNGAAAGAPPVSVLAQAPREEPARPVPQAGQRAAVLAVRHGSLLVISRGSVVPAKFAPAGAG